MSEAPENARPPIHVPTARVLVAVYRELSAADQISVDAEIHRRAVKFVRDRISSGTLEPIRESTIQRPSGRWDAEVARCKDFAFFVTLVSRGHEARIRELEDFPEALEESEICSRLRVVGATVQRVTGALASNAKPLHDARDGARAEARDGKLASVGPDRDAWPEGRE